MKKNVLFLLLGIMPQLMQAQEMVAYAVLSTDHKTLTFKYDAYPPSDYYDVKNTDGGNAQPPKWSQYSTNITTIVFEPSFANARPTTCYHWFQYFTNLTTVDGIENLNTSETTDMTGMFLYCINLVSLNVSGFNTTKVESMSHMFDDCTNLTIEGLEMWDVSNVTEMKCMFNECHFLTSLEPLRNWNVSNVIDMECMFEACHNLTSVDLSNWNTSSVTNIRGLFYNCQNLTSVTFGKNFSMENAIDANSYAYFDLFYKCDKLRYIDFFASDDTDAITSANYSDMFYEVPATTVIYLPHGSQYVTDAQNVVYSYNGDETDLRCPEYYSEDKVDIEFPRDFKTHKAIYQRTMANNYGSVILPYDFTTNDKIQAYTLDEEHETNMYFRDTQTVEAHTPFAFNVKPKGAGNVVDFTMTDSSNNFGITVKATHTTHPNETGWDGIAGSPYSRNTNLGGWTTKGYYVNQTIEKTDPLYSDLHYIAGEKFYKAAGETLIFPPHRVTFHGTWAKGNPSAGAKSFVFAASGNEVITAIKEAETRQTLRDAEATYDLAGRRQHETQKGVNIVRMKDGSVRKMFVK